MVWGKKVPVDGVQKYSALFIGFIGKCKFLLLQLALGTETFK